MERLVRVQSAPRPLPREQQLAWALAEVAADPTPPPRAVAEAVADRLIDTVAVAVAALDRPSVATARAMALDHPRPEGALVLGVGADRRVDCAWAAWANGTAARELDFNDTFLAADYAHPSDAIAPLLAVAQQCGADGAALGRAIATAYEVQVALTRAICLHAHGIDHVAHLAPAVVAGLGALLGLAAEPIYHAIGQSVHVSCATRQSRKGTISSWKAFAPAHVGKAAIEAVDRCLRGETSPSPIYEGRDGVLSRLLGGPEASYLVRLPDRGQPKKAILETYPKAHSAEYQAQALIDLAADLRPSLLAAVAGDWERVASVVIHGSHHTHQVIGTGSGDPEKYSPDASRETLDHSAPYIFAVALQDGEWHHERSYLDERVRRPDTVALWRKVTTVEDPSWTARYHDPDPRRRALGGRAVVTLVDGRVIDAELEVAHAHPRGRAPFGRVDYFAKFRRLCSPWASAESMDRFLEAAARLEALSATQVASLQVALPDGVVEAGSAGAGLAARCGAGSAAEGRRARG